MSANRFPILSRVLAALAPLLVALTLWVPIQYTGGDRVFSDITLLSGGLLGILTAGSALVLAVLFWLPRFRLWLPVAVAACVVFLAASLGFLRPTGGCWDGIDSEGRPIGNCVTSIPWFGMAALAGALVCMAIATAAAFIEQRRPPRDQFRPFGSTYPR